MSKRKKPSKGISPEEIREQTQQNTADYLFHYFSTKRRNELLMVLELEDALASMPPAAAEPTVGKIKLFQSETAEVIPFRPLYEGVGKPIDGSDGKSIAPVELTRDEIEMNMSHYLMTLLREGEAGTRGNLNREELENVLNDALFALASQLRPDDPGKASRAALENNEYQLPATRRERE